MATMPSLALRGGAFSLTGRQRERTNRARTVRPSAANRTTSASARSEGRCRTASNQSHSSALAVMDEPPYEKMQRGRRRHLQLDEEAAGVHLRRGVEDVAGGHLERRLRRGPCEGAAREERAEQRVEAALHQPVEAGIVGLE